MTLNYTSLSASFLLAFIIKRQGFGFLLFVLACWVSVFKSSVDAMGFHIENRNYILIFMNNTGIDIISI